MLAQRWRWPVLGFLIGAILAAAAGWHFITPNFTATGLLLRYETPGTDFFKTTTPLSQDTFAGMMREPDLLRRIGERASPTVPPEKLSKRIRIDTDSESDIIKVTLVDTNPKQAVYLLNAYLEEAVAYTRDLQASQAGMVANAYLRKQLEQMDQDITVLHREFRGMPVSPSVTNKLAEVGGQLNSLNRSLGDSARSPALIGMQTERLNHALAELTELMSKYTDIHPLVRQKQSEVDALRAQIVHESTNATLGTGAAIAGGGDHFNPELDIIRTKLLSLEEGRVQLSNRQREAELYAANPPGLARVFAPATLKTVQGNMRRIKVGVATVFGGALGIGFSLAMVLFVEFADKRLRTPEDVERVTGLPVLTALGDLRQMTSEERSRWAFRTWMMLQGRLSYSANHGLVCGVTSSAAGEGRSTWINLLSDAASLAGFRVLTIATQPSPTHVEWSEEDAPGSPADQGIMRSAAPSTALAASVLNSPNQITDQLTGPNSQPMVHIPLPGWVWNLERRKQWREALNHWRQIENLVIFVELPPASVSEAVLLGSNLPNMLWLSDCGSAEAARTREQLVTLRDAQCNLVGAVLNRHSTVSLRKHFPRWVACAAFATLLGSAGLLAQESNTAQQPQPAPGPAQPPPAAAAPSSPPAAAPGTAPPATPEEPVLEPRTNLSFSIVNPAQRAAWQQRLTLGPGDVLTLGLYGEPEVTRADVAVGPDGRISFLEAEDVPATGLTIDELRMRLDQELSKYRRGPRTMVSPVAFRSKKYYMLGNVMAKGVYTLDRPLTVLEAIARAKGIENGLVDRNIVDLADYSRSFVARNSRRYPINFEKLFQAGDLSQNIAVEPGDYIYIASSGSQEVYVVGEVRLPGPVNYTPNMTLMAALTARGGYTDRAYKARVLVVRGSLNHPEAIAIDTHAILDAKALDFKLQPRDIIYVNSRPFIRVEELADVAMTAFIQSLISSWVNVRVLKPFVQ
jgi:protein involved in polysaccharide export with SLBB domain/capsular polysaccharide biosynthesis protein